MIRRKLRKVKTQSNSGILRRLSVNSVDYKSCVIFFLVYFRNNFYYWLLAFSVMLLAWRCKRFRAILWTQLIKSMKCITNLTINLGPCYCWSWDALNVTSERNGCFLIHDMIRIRDGHHDTEMSCEN